LRSLKFPSLNFKEEEEGQLSESHKTRWCMSFGEAASVIMITSSIGHFLQVVLKRSSRGHLGMVYILWYPRIWTAFLLQISIWIQWWIIFENLELHDQTILATNRSQTWQREASNLLWIL
jgi:hypothetical protein